MRYSRDYIRFAGCEVGDVREDIRAQVKEQTTFPVRLEGWYRIKGPSWQLFDDLKETVKLKIEENKLWD